MHTSSPQPGTVVRVRQRTWLVNDTDERRYQSALVRLSCLDDDAAGQPLEVLWEHELDAEIVPDEPRLLDRVSALDEPRMFGAYLNALRWNCVTSTDKRLLQSPFRAGIDLKAYQLEPIRKALELPRVNLFIADDVGLGKTIEAGLILQELILRQRVDRVLVVAPPAVTLQWQEELEQRFGLQFALYDREYISARRRERGFGVNPWTTHSRFIVSFALLRGSRSRSGKGTQHLELLLNALKDRPGRSLLIIDECHQVAPSSGSLYPIDSRTTRAIRQLTPHFEHRLFLSATPHNGHSHSFASLLHLLDPQRFTHGVPIQSARELGPVMVRRLKRHLRQHVGGFPERKLVDHTIELSTDAPEIALGTLLSEYDALYRACLGHLPRAQQVARGLVVVNLHKRLLSSIPAFHHTLPACFARRAQIWTRRRRR
jgi:SNF2 family DNA or RNA helicase